MRKYASTHARKNGCSKDEQDIRGCWKKGKRNSDVYDNIEIPFPDAKVAGISLIKTLSEMSLNIDTAALS